MIKNVTTTETRLITFEAVPLWVRLGALSRSLGVGQELIIDASSSVDPNRKDNSVCLCEIYSSGPFQINNYFSRVWNIPGHV